MVGYTPEDEKIQVPVLSIYVRLDSADYILADLMTADQIAQVVEFLNNERLAFQKESVDRFRRLVPHARIVDIPKGHHYCFIKQEELVFDEMRRFLLE
jgi:pimeloyl-ACP methyl ester carboxylesterase